MKDKRTISILITIVCCIVYTKIFHDPVIGISTGFLMGIAFGLFSDEKDGKEEK